MQTNNDYNSVFCFPEPGKPNPHEPHIPGQMRSRVVRHRQKGNTCVYYGLQILLDEAKSSKQEQSNSEKLLSFHRRRVTLWTEKWNFIEFLVHEIYNSNLTGTKATSHLLVQAAANKNDSNLNSLVQKFCEQEIYDDFAQYVNATRQKELEHIHSQLIEQINYPKDQIDEYCQSTFNVPYELVENPQKFIPAIPIHLRESILKSAASIKVGLLHGIYVRISKEVYGLEISSWTPDQPINSLIKELQLHGPHMVFANLGKPIYTTPPIKLKDKIEKRTIFGWSPNSKRIESHGSHTIVIVGAEVVNNKGYVYFLDPSTESSDYNSQEIFKVSYERLLSTILDLRQRHYAFRKQEFLKGKPGIAPFVNEYALYCPKYKEKSKDLQPEIL